MIGYTCVHMIKPTANIACTIIVVLLIAPVQAMAAQVQVPSTSSMWLELILLLVMFFVLKFAKFSNQRKFISFITYVLSGIITKTILFPVLLFVIMFYFYSRSTDDDSWN